MTARFGVLAGLLLAVAVAGCGSSAPSSDVSILTPAPGASASAPASQAPTAGTTASSSPSASATAAPTVEAIGQPPKPGKPTFKRISEVPGQAEGTFTDTFKITWTAPEGAADSFLVYGLSDCLRDQKKFDGKPCVVKGMKIPADKLTLLGVAPGDQREMTISWDIGEIGLPPYSTILIRAKNSKGPSIFTIVHSDAVCHNCTY